MKKIATLMITVLLLLVSFSIASASPSDNADSSWQQEFAAAAEAKGLDQAIKDARSEGKAVLDIIVASIAAGFGDHVIVVALMNAGTGRAEIVSAGTEAGLNLQIVTAALSASGSDEQGELGFSEADANQALSHPSSQIAGGSGSPANASPSTF